MRTFGNTVLITGGSAGIGLELALALAERGNDVIICARRAALLDEAQRRDPRLHVHVADVSLRQDREGLLELVQRQFPLTNILVNNAGIQHRIDFQSAGRDLAKVDEEIATNLTAPIHLSALFVPQLGSQADAAIVNVSSGLAFAPLAHMPVYCATKAALHSMTLSLRHQLRDTTIRVFEVIPPIVATELGVSHRPKDMNASAMSAEAAAAGIIDALERDIFEAPLGDAANLHARREALFPMMNRA
jgi:uncharacterized oxidoreductase